jgi:hypothetical protein
VLSEELYITSCYCTHGLFLTLRVIVSVLFLIFFQGWSNVALHRYNCLHATVKASRKLQSEKDDDAKWMADMVIKVENERLKKRKQEKENFGRCKLGFMCNACHGFLG